MNGDAWTRQEIDLLVEIVEGGGCLRGLSSRLRRSEQAVTSKARKLDLRAKGFQQG